MREANEKREPSRSLAGHRSADGRMGRGRIHSGGSSSEPPSLDFGPVGPSRSRQRRLRAGRDQSASARRRRARKGRAWAQRRDYGIRVPGRRTLRGPGEGSRARTQRVASGAAERMGLSDHLVNHPSGGPLFWVRSSSRGAVRRGSHSQCDQAPTFKYLYMSTIPGESGFSHMTRRARLPTSLKRRPIRA